MGLSKRTVWIITSAMVIALGGLVILQASLLRSAMAQKEQTFRQNVQAALADVSRSLETAETVTATLHVIGSNYEVMIRRENESTFTAFDTTFSDSSRHMAVGFIGEALNRDRDHAVKTFCDSINFWKGKAGLPGDTLTDSATTAIMIQLVSDTLHDSLPGGFFDEDITALKTAVDSNRAGVIQRVINRLQSGGRIPLEKRIKREQLDSLVQRSLVQYGVELEPVYAVMTENDTTLSFENRPGFGPELRQSELKTVLFPSDFMSPAHTLVFYFPDRASYALRQVGPMLAATVLFMVVIVGGFGYAVRTIIGLRRATRHMVEFVNNMTHEFKTPISTVALACEAILRPDVIDDPQRVKRFSQMIQDENRRMRTQAEKILQMAALEESRGTLQLAPVDIHEVVHNAVEGVRLQVEHRGGRITCDLRSTRPVVDADELHLTGVFYNLLDNANKYSPENPAISVITDDCDGGIRIIVADNGIGIRPEDRRRIFDKYYRVQHGNVHEVKGFGLGLSYAALMVQAHGGRIDVDSEPGKGTKMIVWLPRSRRPEESGGQL